MSKATERSLLFIPVIPILGFPLCLPARKLWSLVYATRCLQASTWLVRGSPSLLQGADEGIGCAIIEYKPALSRVAQQYLNKRSNFGRQ